LGDGRKEMGDGIARSQEVRSQESGCFCSRLNYKTKALRVCHVERSETSERLVRNTDRRIAQVAQILRCALDDKAESSEQKLRVNMAAAKTEKKRKPELLGRTALS
jgi:hypothetical protein